MSRSGRSSPWIAVAVAVLLAGIWLWQQQGARTSPDEPSRTPSRGATPLAPDEPVGRVAEADLPDQAQRVLRRIDSGGPFQYDEDGSVFQNREGLLPDRDRGYYREYTVETPGSTDRGARRIVTGAPGEYYWTENHYQSFDRIEREAP